MIKPGVNYLGEPFPDLKSEHEHLKSFKYQESTRQRVEREAMERMTRIYNCKTAQKYFPKITEQDVYGQSHSFRTDSKHR